MFFYAILYAYDKLQQEGDHNNYPKHHQESHEQNQSQRSPIITGFVLSYVRAYRIADFRAHQPITRRSDQGGFAEH
jgi:hypothetical protein